MPKAADSLPEPTGPDKPEVPGAARKSRGGIRLGLAPLTKSNKGEVLNAAGFASGIGPLGQVVVPDLAELSLGNATFRNVDSGYLKLVDDAIRSEKDSSTATANKIQKWETVRDARPEGDFVDEANGRIKEWKDVLEAENRRRAEQRE